MIHMSLYICKHTHTHTRTHAHTHVIHKYLYCRFLLVCLGKKVGERNFFWAWYKLKLICLLYFHFVPSPEKVSHAKFFPETGGGQIKWKRQ